MGRLFHPLLFFLARCTRHELIRQIEFLKAENKMCRKQVPKQHIWLKPDERNRLLELALAIGLEVGRRITALSSLLQQR